MLRLGQQRARRADLLGCHRRRSTEFDAAGPGRGQSLVGAFDNQLADELGERGEDVEHQPPAACGGVDRLVQRSEPDTAPPQVDDQRDQVM